MTGSSYVCDVDAHRTTDVFEKCGLPVTITLKLVGFMTDQQLKNENIRNKMQYEGYDFFAHAEASEELKLAQLEMKASEIRRSIHAYKCLKQHIIDQNKELVAQLSETPLMAVIREPIRTSHIDATIQAFQAEQQRQLMISECAL